MNEECKWKLIGQVWPVKDSTFLLSWDGYWIKASRGNKEFIVVEWLMEKFTWDLNELATNYWFEVPHPPNRLRSVE